MDLRSFDAALWKKVCDEGAIGPEHWIRDNPRPAGPAGNCLCTWCSTTRVYVERSAVSASDRTT
jgi:hypothetical protein